jgi:DNA replication initiation complex subunit (GINS family)
MSTEPMTLRDLRVQTFKERKEGRLTRLPATFYRRLKILEIQIREIIEESKGNAQRLEKANADVRKFSDMKLELHKNRERKLTDLAREKVNGQNPNMKNVHQNENEYLISLCTVIKKHRANTLLNETPIDTDVTVLEEKRIEPEEKTTIKIEPQNNEYIEIKVLEDLPTFTGMDAKNYSLKNKDIISIPIYNARILSDAGKVRLVKEVEA